MIIFTEHMFYVIALVYHFNNDAPAITSRLTFQIFEIVSPLDN